MKYNFKGVTSALLTPFDQGKIDLKSLTNLVEYQIKNGINGFVVNGTTAESPTLLWAEVETIYKTVRKISGDKLPIIIGTGSNSTDQTAENSRKASELGADAVLVVVPYYNKPPQRGLVQHFNKIAEASSAPVILYNVPGRTITALSEESILELSKNKKIIGIKEASGDIAFDTKINKLVPENFVKLSGDDGTFVSFLKCGGDGIISVMSNIITKACAGWLKQAHDKNWNELENDFAKYEKLITAMYSESNPIASKYMLYKMGLFSSPEMRLPLVELDKKYHEMTVTLLKEFSLV